MMTVFLKFITLGGFLAQGSTALVAITAVHAGAVTALFWSLVATALPAIEIVGGVADRTCTNLLVISFGDLVTSFFFIASAYIAFDVGFTLTQAVASKPPEAVVSVPLFVLTSVWPSACVVPLALRSYSDPLAGLLLSTSSS